MKAPALAAALFVAACTAPELPEFTSGTTYIAKHRGVEITTTISRVEHRWVAELQYSEPGKPTTQVPLYRLPSSDSVIFQVVITPGMTLAEWIRFTNGRRFVIKGNRIAYKDLDETFWKGKAVK